jgi:2-keto-4-pentenoate hydratase/2-oxohepta-3-ene-1,7-dioic acid hydratase in catechol pathway
MKLGTAITDEGLRAIVIEGEEAFVADIDLMSAIAGGVDLIKRPGRWAKLHTLQLDVPLRPPMLLCTGSNYRDHLDEHEDNAAPTNAPQNEFEFFIKAGQTIADLNDPLSLDPAFGAKIDQETELGLVIGPNCPRGISEAEAAHHIFGYLVVNDVTARDKQVRLTESGAPFMVLGASKNFEGSTRLSSYLVTADEVADVYNLPLRTRVNGALTQSNSTANVINNFSLIVSTFASGLTLQPGCIISTGTPGGTGWGQDKDLGGKGLVPAGCTAARYLLPGDLVESEIEGVGSLSFEVVG